MTLIEKIVTDFKSAYKQKEMEKKNFLGVLRTEVTKESKTPEDAHVVAKIKSMIKNAEATNSLSVYELEILGVYLPVQLTEERVTAIVTEFLSENANTNMGQVMGHLKNTYGGQYDGRMASSVVKKLV
jgi:uncharacterized protein YqeY